MAVMDDPEITLCCLLWAHPGAEEALVAYEDRGPLRRPTPLPRRGPERRSRCQARCKRYRSAASSAHSGAGTRPSKVR